MVTRPDAAGEAMTVRRRRAAHRERRALVPGTRGARRRVTVPPGGRLDAATSDPTALGARVRAGPDVRCAWWTLRSPRANEPVNARVIVAGVASRARAR